MMTSRLSGTAKKTLRRNDEELRVEGSEENGPKEGDGGTPGYKPGS